MHLFWQPGMGDNEASLVEHVMADERVDELRHLGPELRWFDTELLKAPVETVSGRDVATLQGAEQLHLMIAGETDCTA